MMEDTDWDQEFESKCALQDCEEFLVLIANYAKEMHQKEANKEMVVKSQGKEKFHNTLKMLKRNKHKAYSKEKREFLKGKY